MLWKNVEVSIGPSYILLARKGKITIDIVGGIRYTPEQRRLLFTHNIISVNTFSEIRPKFSFKAHDANEQQ